MQKIQFNKGEQRHVRCMIHAVDDAPFTIHSATWTLSYGETIEDSGDCKIEGHIIDAYICPSKSIRYVLRLEYVIADETLIENIEVAVV